MKWRKYKKKVKKICGKENCKFKKENGKYYLATRVCEALTFISNYWLLLDFRGRK